MKKMIKYFAALVLGAMMMTACSEDYLETGPTNALNKDQLASNVENYGTYINGINLLMVYQQGAYGQGYCGMMNLLDFMGNNCGNDWSVENFGTGRANGANMKLTVSNQAAWSSYSWWFLYQIIGQANRILASIDEAEGDSNLRDFYKAQALTYRAYCYQYLVQIFAKRWMDSNNGSTPGVILKLDDSNETGEVSSLAECYAQIYRDCDDAIALFNQSGMDASEFYEPSLALAIGVKARAALCREDWATAAEYAGMISESYGLMSATEFQSGFHTANSEWIFGGYGDENENMWYYTFGAYYGYNGYYSGAGGYNIVGNRELVDVLPDTDARKQLFLAESLVGANMQEAIQGGEMYSQLRPTPGSDSYNKLVGYMLSVPGVYNNIRATGYLPALPSFYGQLKFGVFGLPGIHHSVYMRAAEMYLTQAEALCKQATPDYATAQDLLYAVNSRLDPSYQKSTKTGQELIDEIMFYRRVELWGEGHAWFDLKRTGDSISRKGYANNGAGTFGSLYAVTVGPNDEGTNDWTWVIPLIETQYNDAVK